MSKKTKDAETSLLTGEPKKRTGPLTWLRGRFLTGLVVSAPIGITIFLTWSFVNFVDQRIKPLIPAQWNPETYTKFALPGLGLVVAVLVITLIGTVAANLIGKTLLNTGDWLIGRVPLVRSVHMTLKQVFEIFTSSQSRSFREVVMVEYPRKGSWALGFLTAEAKGQVARNAPGTVGVFVPTTPNPTSGFLIYVDRSEIRPLDMTVEEGAKLIISAGLVAPDDPEEAIKSVTGDDAQTDKTPENA